MLTFYTENKHDSSDNNNNNGKMPQTKIKIPLLWYNEMTIKRKEYVQEIKHIKRNIHTEIQQDSTNSQDDKIYIQCTLI